MGSYPPTLFSCRDLATTPASIAAAPADAAKDPGPAFRLLSLDGRSVGQPKYGYRGEFCGSEGSLTQYLKLADPFEPAGDRKPGNVLRQRQTSDGKVSWEPVPTEEYLAADQEGRGRFMAPRKEKDGSVAHWPEGDVKTESKWEFLVSRTVELDHVRALTRQTGKRAGQVIATSDHFEVWFRPSVDRQLREWLDTARLQSPERDPTGAWFRLIYDEQVGPQDRYKLTFAGWERPAQPGGGPAFATAAPSAHRTPPARNVRHEDDEVPLPPAPDDPTIGLPEEDIRVEDDMVIAYPF